MTLTLKSKQSKPLPTLQLSEGFMRPKGLLNSNYKSVVDYNLEHANSKSIYGIKQRLKGRRYRIAYSIETCLKLSGFAMLLVFIF